jgi:hypothetical protein
MTITTISKLLRKFGELQQHADCEPVEITRLGRRVFILISAECYDCVRALPGEPIAPPMPSMSSTTASEVRAEMDSEHTARDKLSK